MDPGDVKPKRAKGRRWRKGLGEHSWRSASKPTPQKVFPVRPLQDNKAGPGSSVPSDQREQAESSCFSRHIRHPCARPYGIFHIVPSFALQHSSFWPILVWASPFSAAESDTRATSLNREEVHENSSFLKKCNFQLVALSPRASKSSPSYFLKQDNDSAVRGSQFHFYEVKPDWIIIFCFVF